MKTYSNLKMKFLILAVLVAGAYASVSSDEAGLVKSTWAQVKNNEADILYAVFKAYPDIQARFPAFVGKDLDSIKGSAAFTMHASRIVALLNQYVGLLGNDAYLPAITTIFSEMGSNHANRGVSKAQFGEFKTALIGYMKGHVSWGANVEHAWNDAFDQMYGFVFAKLH